jgi:hypothetical protein
MALCLWSAGAAVVRVTPQVSWVGVHGFAHWRAQHDAFAPVVAQLMQAAQTHKQTHPEERGLDLLYMLDDNEQKG